jgi:GT2 family glycosyltransferase
MISIVISTYKPLLFERVSQSIEATIGVAYEIIAIENHAQYSICEVYNMGEAKSKYPYLCFVHEDVLFKTQDWGKKLISTMHNDTSIGLIGVAGTKFKSSYLSALGQSLLLRRLFMRGHIFHWGTEYTDFDSTLIHNEIEDVVCIDGVFMFVQKDVFKTCRFDDKLLTHFHGYDIDFSLQVFFQSFRVIVDRAIILDHHSSGDYSKLNVNANRKIGKKWLRKLPVATKDTNLSVFKLHYFDLLNWAYFLKTAFKRKLQN